MLEITPDTWLVSDTHLGHKNIVKYCDRPKDHESRIIKAWNSLVPDNADILHLGDLAVWYGPTEDFWLQTVSELPGKKHLIRGNHDKRKDRVYAGLGIEVIPEFIQEIKGQRVLFSHYPDETRTSSWDINIHGHIHNNPLEPRLAMTKRRYKNISIEVMDYEPIQACELLTF